MITGFANALYNNQAISLGIYNILVALAAFYTGGGLAIIGA